MASSDEDKHMTEIHTSDDTQLFTMKKGKTDCDNCPINDFGVDCFLFTAKIGVDCDKYDLSTISKIEQ